MDEQELNKMLSSLQAPEPSKDAQDQAVSHAMAAFDKKTQGKSKTRRLTDIDPFNNVRRFIMQKKYIYSGMAGAVSVIALMTVLGTPFITTQMDRLQVAQRPVPVSAAPQSMPKEDRIDTRQRIEPEVKKAERAAQEIDAAVSAMTSSEKERPLSHSKPIPTAAMTDKSSIEGASAGKGGKDVGVLNLNAPALDKESIAPRKAILSLVPQTPSMSAPTIVGQVGDEQQLPYYKDTGRDKFEHVEENPVKSVTSEPVSTFSIDVDTSSYAFMRKLINQGTLPQKDAVRPEEMINYFDYAYPLADTREQPFKPSIAVFDAPWKKGDKLVHIGIKGYDIAPAEKPRSNLVFLLDVSGSMNSPDKLPLLQNSLKMLLDSLNPEDTVGIVVYAGNAGTVLEPTKARDKQKIITALENLSAGGSTAGAEGIRQAYNLAEQNFIKDGVNRVILATDGDFNVGITDQNELKSFIERKRDTGIFLSVLGFGQGNYNDSMMQTLAQNGNGNAAYIDTLSEARKVLVQEASSTLFTIAKDVKIQVEFNPALVKEYRLIGYETRHLNREDFNNDKVDAGDIGSGHEVTAIYQITPMDGQAAVDALRYGDKKPPAPLAEDKIAANEYAFLKIRYKLPKEDVSKLITRPITHADEISFDKASDDVRFATSVAGFAELLKGSKYTGTLTYDDIIKTAEEARGKDEFGYRSEFVNLVRLAKSSAAMEPLSK